jgi:hypothetical protein
MAARFNPVWFITAGDAFMRPTAVNADFNFFLQTGVK